MVDGSSIERRTQAVSLVVIATVMVGAALMWLRPVMIPLVLAVLLTHALLPLVDFLQDRARVPRGLAITLALAVCLLLFLALAAMISSSVDKLARDAPIYERQIRGLVDGMGGRFADWGRHAIDEALAGLPIGTVVVSAGKQLASLLSNTFLVLIFAVYLLLGRRVARGDGIRGRIEAKIRRYLVVKAGLSLLTGVAIWLTLSALGVDLALLFGILAMVLNFVPNVGAIISTVLPIPVALVDPQFSPAWLALVVGIPILLQIVLGNVLETKLMGESMALHPITVLVALVIWGMLWGVPGLLLAVPLTAAVEILLGELELTRPVARLMAGHSPDEGGEGVAPAANARGRRAKKGRS